MKSIIFYITAVVTTLLFSMEISSAWFIFAIVDFILILWCNSNITMRKITKLTGYNILYKMLNSGRFSN